MLTVKELILELNLAAHAGTAPVGSSLGLGNVIEESRFRIPGLELTGYFRFFQPGQILLLGPAEISYLQQLKPDFLRKSLTGLFSQSFPCMIVSRDIELPPLLLDAADQSGRPLLTGEEDDLSRLAFRLTNYLHLKFVPRKTIHGVFVEVNGVGILLLGKSSTGKSECALELIKRGHRLIADDSVELLRVASKSLLGKSNPLIGHHMEIRGLGIIDIARLFGISATAQEKRVDLIARFVRAKDNQIEEFDRLGLDVQTETILDVQIACKIIPVRAGQNLAILVETAALDFDLKKSGTNSAKNFTNLLKNHIQSQVKVSEGDS